MTQTEHKRERLSSGNVDVWLRDDGVWGVSWEPDPGHEDYPGVTYTQHDTTTPTDFPKAYDPDELLAWARLRWGHR